MFNPLACLSFNLQRQEEDQQGAANNYPSPPSTTPSTPRSWSSNSTKNGSNIFCIYGRNKKNPFSKLGLDKFSTLLTDLEERRRKIFEQLPSKSHHVPYIHFIYSNSGDWVPIVVQFRDLNNHKHSRLNKQKHKKASLAAHHHRPRQPVTDKKAQPPPDNNNPPSSRSRCATTTTTLAAINSSSKASSTLKSLVQFRQPPPVSSSSADVRTKAANKKKIQITGHRHNIQRPSQYLPIVLLLSLVWLVLFGRSVAILLTSACWYLTPTVKTPAATPTVIPKPKRSSFVKKEYAARKSISQNNISPN